MQKAAGRLLLFCSGCDIYSYMCLMIITVSRMCTFPSRSVVTQKKFKNKTSNQKAKEEYEKIKAEHDRKKEVNSKQSSFLILIKAILIQFLSLILSSEPREDHSRYWNSSSLFQLDSGVQARRHWKDHSLCSYYFCPAVANNRILLCRSVHQEQFRAWSAYPYVFY